MNFHFLDTNTGAYIDSVCLSKTRRGGGIRFPDLFRWSRPFDRFPNVRQPNEPLPFSNVEWCRTAMLYSAKFQLEIPGSSFYRATNPWFMLPRAIEVYLKGTKNISTGGRVRMHLENIFRPLSCRVLFPNNRWSFLSQTISFLSLSSMNYSPFQRTCLKNISRNIINSLLSFKKSKKKK